MPCHSSLSEKTIGLSASLAARLGLEEAVLLTVLNDCARLQTQNWARINSQILRKELPFWDDARIRQVLQSLIQKGEVKLSGPLFPEAEGLVYQFASAATQAEPAPVAAHKAAPAASASFNVKQPLAQAWQPQADTLTRIGQHGIPASFALSLRDQFVLKAQEEGGKRNDWESRFFNFVKSQWVYTQNDANRAKADTTFPINVEEALPIAPNWKPRAETLEILQKGGVDSQFIQDAVPEFVLYWLERGEVSKTWNNRFLKHVRTQWLHFTHAEQHSTAPTAISEDWRPSDDCLDIINMALIDRQFAESLVPEFVLYWRDSNQLHTSWNSRFLQYVKLRWSSQLHNRGNGYGSTTTEPGYATAEASRQRLSDTSWAE